MPNLLPFTFVNQRLRFFLRYRQLILFVRTGTGDVFEDKVVLHDDDGAVKKALVWFDTGSKKIKIKASTGGIPDDYLEPRELFFDDNENSFWNDATGDVPGIIIGTGDLRDLTSGDDMNSSLLTLNVPTAEASAIIFEFVEEFVLKLHAKSPIQ